MNHNDPFGNESTQASHPYNPNEHYRPLRVQRGSRLNRRSGNRRGCTGCILILLALLLLAGLPALLYLFMPLQTNLLLLGIDRPPVGTSTSRTDTIVLMRVNPLAPKVTLLSIPRDLWVPIPGVGENRINTAHFFAEAKQKGSGPQAVLNTFEADFGVKIPYYMRVQFDGFKEIVNAMGGITLNFPQDMGGFTTGTHHLNGDQALGFARDRKGADDFFRMQHAQMLLSAAAKQMLNPLEWVRLPLIYAAVMHTVDTNVPFWQIPRLGVAVLRASISGMDSHTLSREMTTPFTTNQGAQVLLPKWDMIRPLLKQLGF